MLILEPLVAFGQSPSPSTGFDVISIKRNVTGANDAWTPPLQHGKLRFTNVTVKDVLSLAYYPIDLRHMKGGPDWIGTAGARYDIEATTEERVVTEERYHQMLQMMLADRFRLRVHVEAHEEPCFWRSTTSELLLSRIVRRVVDTRLKFPSGQRLHVRILVVPVVLDPVLVSA